MEVFVYILMWLGLEWLFPSKKRSKDMDEAEKEMGEMFIIDEIVLKDDHDEPPNKEST